MITLRKSLDDYHKLIADAVVTHSTDHGGRLVDYIEIGVLTGNSAEAILATGKVRRAVLIDNWSLQDPPTSREAVEDRLSPYAGIFELREGNSNDVLKTITEQFDVGFVDGDHKAESCLADMTNMLPLLREDGVMFIHDLTNPDYSFIKGLVETFAEKNQLKFIFHGHVHNSLGELRRK